MFTKLLIILYIGDLSVLPHLIFCPVVYFWYHLFEQYLFIILCIGLFTTFFKVLLFKLSQLQPLEACLVDPCFHLACLVVMLWGLGFCFLTLLTFWKYKMPLFILCTLYPRTIYFSKELWFLLLGRQYWEPRSGLWVYLGYWMFFLIDQWFSTYRSNNPFTGYLRPLENTYLHYGS